MFMLVSTHEREIARAERRYQAAESYAKNQGQLARDNMDLARRAHARIAELEAKLEPFTRARKKDAKGHFTKEYAS